jgi:hypothetical protein
MSSSPSELPTEGDMYYKRLQSALVTTPEDSSTFMGVPLEALSIDSVEWSEDAVQHMKERRAEQGVRCPEPEEATEAALDPDRVVRIAAAGRSLKVVGRCASSGSLIKVWLWPKDMSNGEWFGGSAVDANGTDENIYERLTKEVRDD